jgi:hypothetical protein
MLGFLSYPWSGCSSLYKRAPKARSEQLVCSFLCDGEPIRPNLERGEPANCGWRPRYARGRARRHAAGLAEVVDRAPPQEDQSAGHGRLAGFATPGPRPLDAALVATHAGGPRHAGSAATFCSSTPPVLPVTDPLVLSGLVDSMLLVASAGETTKRAQHRAVELLREINAPLLGTMLIDCPGETP